MSTTQKHKKFLFLFFISFSSFATEIDYSLGITIAKYDNLNLEQNPVEDEISESVSAALIIAENTANLVANLEASIESIHYRNDQADDENLGHLLANALWVINPGRYEWYVSDTYTQTLINTLDRYTPNNRQNTNAFSTGPNVIWRINPSNSVNLEARAKTISFETTQANIIDTDNNRMEILTNWEYQLQAESVLSLNYTFETINFDDEINNTNFDRNDVFLNLNYQRGLNTYEVDIGMTQINPENTESIDESRFRLSALNTRTSASTLQIELSRNLTDTSSELIDQAPDSVIHIGEDAATADIYLNKTARFIYNTIYASGNLNVDAYKRISDYRQQNQLDQIEKGLILTGIRDIQSRSQISLIAHYTNSVFDNVSREDDIYLYTLLYNYNARRNVTVGLETTVEERQSNDPTNDYEDLRIFLSLTYSTL